MEPINNTMISNPNDGIGFIVKEKLAALQTALLSAHPTMPGLLREIHSKLMLDKAIVTLMSEEEIQLVVSGLARQTNMEIAASFVAKKGSKKSSAKITADFADEL